MVTSPAPNATRLTRPLRSTHSEPLHTDRPELREPWSVTSDRTGIVVRLELPDIDDDGRQPADHSGSSSVRSSRSVHRLDHKPDVGRESEPAVVLDPQQVARALGELLRALSPGLRAQVRIDVIPAIPAINPLAGLPPVEPFGPDTELNADLTLDVRSRTLTVDGEAVALTRREFDLLSYLQHRQGEAFSRPELMSAVWRTGYLEGDRTVDVHIRRIRMKLGRHAYRLTTLRGYGYRLD